MMLRCLLAGVCAGAAADTYAAAPASDQGSWLSSAQFYQSKQDRVAGSGRMWVTQKSGSGQDATGRRCVRAGAQRGGDPEDPADRNQARRAGHVPGSGHVAVRAGHHRQRPAQAQPHRAQLPQLHHPRAPPPLPPCVPARQLCGCLFVFALRSIQFCKARVSS